MKRYRIKSIFGPTLQGEGTHAGRVVSFVRFSGCNKWSGAEEDRSVSICRYCDTDFVGAERLTAADIIERLVALGGPKRIVLSGGEPALQVDADLMLALTEAGYQCHLETNGSMPLGKALSLFHHITMSPKQPMAETRLERCDDLKLLWPPIAPGIAPEDFASFPHERMYLQAVWDAQYEANLKSAIAEVVRRDARLSVQTHKIIGVE